MAPAPARSPVSVDASQLLRHARQRAGLTQVQLAERAGVTQSVISTYENGRREPSLTALQRLLHAAGFDAVVDLRPAVHRPSLRDRIAAARDDLLALVTECGASNPRLFGSVARGDDGPGSDVELMVDLAPGSGIFCLLRIQDGAERLLGVRVDVADAAGVRGSALREAVPL